MFGKEHSGARTVAVRASVSVIKDIGYAGVFLLQSIKILISEV